MTVQVLMNKFSCAKEVYKIAIIRWRVVWSSSTSSPRFGRVTSTCSSLSSTRVARTSTHTPGVCANHSVKVEFSAPDRKLRGERAHDLLNRGTRACLATASHGVSLSDWSYARAYSTYALNIRVRSGCSTRWSSMSPEDAPDLSVWMPFGSTGAIYKSEGANGLVNKGMIAGILHVRGPEALRGEGNCIWGLV